MLKTHWSSGMALLLKTRYLREEEQARGARAEKGGWGIGKAFGAEKQGGGAESKGAAGKPAGQGRAGSAGSAAHRYLRVSARKKLGISSRRLSFSYLRHGTASAMCCAGHALVLEYEYTLPRLALSTTHAAPSY